MNWFRVIFIAITRIAFPDEKEEQKKCMDVKLRKTPDLCTGENDFLTKRKKVVFKNIRTKFGHLSEDEEEGAPNIAIIGSGGGIRAVIGMCGAMTALHKNGILDCTLYTAGVSGSAWYLMALYANDKQHSPKELNDIIQHRVNDFRYSTILDIFVRHHIAVIFNALFTTHKDLVLEITNPFGEMIEQLLLEQDFKLKRSKMDRIWLGKQQQCLEKYENINCTEISV